MSTTVEGSSCHEQPSSHRVVNPCREYGYHVVEKKCTVYDLWATVLHQLGMDHEHLTFRHGGRDLRLTDVHGHVIRAILT